MKALFVILITVLTLVGIIALLTFLSNLYNWLRRKYNKPHVGYQYMFSRLLKRGDYVCIKGEVMCFSHFASDGENINPIAFPSEDNKTLGGEIAFSKNGLGYNYYFPSVLRDCEFIYGKYGLKWAVSKKWASIAKEKVNEYINS